MTVADNTSRNQYSATSGQTVFAYTFEIVDKSHIVVLKNGVALSEGTNYSVSNVGNDSGGNVTLTVGATTGDVLTLYRDMPYSRTQNYTNSGDFLASEVNSDFDDLWLAGEQTDRSFSQSIRKPITDSDSISMELPEAATRAGRALTFDSTGAVSTSEIAGITPSTISRQQFTGNGSTTVFTLASDLGIGAGVVIYIDGVYQEEGTYTVSGTTLTFTEAPPINASIEVVSYKVSEIATGDASSISYLPAGTGAIETTVQAKLRESVSVKDFGAVGDSDINSGGGTDDTASIIAAAAYCVSSKSTLFFPSGHVFRITSQIDFSSVLSINAEGGIYADGITGVSAVVIGGLSVTTSGSYYKFAEIHDGGSRSAAPSDPLLRIFGLKNAEVEVQACRYIQIYADSASSSTNSVGYNQFYLGYTFKLELTGALDAASWINENTFFGGRIRELYIGQSDTAGEEYGHNHNVFYFPTFEGASVIDFKVGTNNSIREMRGEGFDGSVSFSALTAGNLIESNYQSTLSPHQLIVDPIDWTYVTDNGVGNIITSPYLANAVRTEILNLAPSTPMVISGTPGSTSNSNASSAIRGCLDSFDPTINTPTKGFSPGLRYLKMPAFKAIYQSDYIFTSKGNAFGIYAAIVAGGFRVSVEVYDTNLNLLGAEGADGEYISSTFLTYDGAGTYSGSANLGNTNDDAFGVRPFGIARSEVRFIKMRVGAGSAGVTFVDFKITGFTDANRNHMTLATGAEKTRTLALDSVPTGGYCDLGTMVADTNGGQIYVCTFEHITTLSAGAASGATSITVTDVTGVVNGDVVGILLDDRTTHWASVSGLSGNTFTITALPDDAGATNLVCFNRWATNT